MVTPVGVFLIYPNEDIYHFVNTPTVGHIPCRSMEVIFYQR